jgi:hypothetical protein
MALPFFTSALHAGEWSASHPGRVTPKEISPGTHYIGGWVGPGAGSDAVETANISCPCRESNSDGQPAARRYTEWDYSAPQLS